MFLSYCVSSYIYPPPDFDENLFDTFVLLLNNKQFSKPSKDCFKAAADVIEEIERHIRNDQYISNSHLLGLEKFIEMREQGEFDYLFVEGINIRITLTENKFNHEIKSKLEVSNKDELYANCLNDHKLFSKLELYNYFKRHLKELKNLDLAFMIISLIFNQQSNN